MNYIEAKKALQNGLTVEVQRYFAGAPIADQWYRVRNIEPVGFPVPHSLDISPEGEDRGFFVPARAEFRTSEKVASRIDLLLRKIAADPAEAEVPEGTEEGKDLDITEEEATSTEEPDLEETVKKDEEEVVRVKSYFTKQFYKELLDGYTRIKNAVSKKKLDYLGEQRIEILKMSFESAIGAIERELKKPVGLSPTGSVVYGKMVSNKEIINDVHSLFTPILDLYEDFERFMGTHQDLAAQFPTTQKNFANLKNVLNNIIKGIPEEIVDIDLTKK